ncbi:MAG: DUF4173 domain-containing protein [Flavobacteriales bacterium]|nr:DUF4173 domain-containing protein [Flavobacteriales bacterium]
MKTTDKLILISGLVFGLLFYRQDFGINYFLFALLQLIGVYSATDIEKKTKHWWLVFTGVLLSGLGILLNGSALAVVANVISMFVLVILSIEPRSSLVISLFHSIYTLVTGIIFMMTDLAMKFADQTGWKGSSKGFKKLIIFLASTFIAIVFVALYRNSNQAFKELTNQIDLSFISGEWIVFTLFGYFLVYLLYRPQFINKVQEYDKNAEDQIQESKEGITAKWMSLQSESTWAKTLLIMLNIVLFVVFVSESLYEIGWLKISESNDYSANVHNGVNAIIFSIVLAVSIILFFFQGRLNFIKDSRLLKILGSVWVVQNILLVILTGWKNWIYIEEYFLTYKRIGVFVYLICCLIGLVFTFIKLNGLKSNWFLVRRVGWTIYTVLLFTPLVNWDALIINYNFSMATERPENLDLDYLLSLPSENYPLIDKRISESSHDYLNEVDNLDYLLYRFKDEALSYDWRSFNFKRYSALKLLLNSTSHKEISYAD